MSQEQPEAPLVIVHALFDFQGQLNECWRRVMPLSTIPSRHDYLLIGATDKNEESHHDLVLEVERRGISSDYQRVLLACSVQYPEYKNLERYSTLEKGAGVLRGFLKRNNFVHQDGPPVFLH
jgi:hypothetical protein